MDGTRPQRRVDCIHLLHVATPSLIIVAVFLRPQVRDDGKRFVQGKEPQIQNGADDNA